VQSIVSVLYGCHLSFEFTREIWVKKIEAHSFEIHLRDLIKHRTLPLYINVSIRSYKFYCGIPTIRKAIQQRVHLITTHKNGLCILARVLGLPYKETFPPDPEVFSLAEK